MASGRWLLIFALVAASLAGCFSPSSPGAEDRQVDAPASFSDPLVIGTGGDAEVSLAVGTNGTVLACSHGGFTRHAMWASTDGGATFLQQDTGDPDVSGDCDVSAGPNAWHYVYSAIRQDALPGGAIASSVIELRLATSRDEGTTWTITAPVPATTMHDRAWLAQDGDSVVIAYVAARPVGLNCADVPDAGIHGCAAQDAVMAVRSADGGRTWSAPVVAYTGVPEPSGVLNGDLVIWDEGRAVGMPLLVLASADAATGSIVFAGSGDGGATWSSRQVATTTLRTFPSASLGDNGELAVAFATGTRERAAVALVTSSDEGVTWGAPRTVTTNATFDRSLTTSGNLIPAVGVSLDGHGTATLAWLEADDRNGTDTWTLHAARITAGPERAVAFSGPVRDSGHGVWSAAYEFLQVRTDPSGDTLVAYPWNAAGCKDSPSAFADRGRNEQCAELVRIPA